jgi:hypothetical protein
MVLAEMLIPGASELGRAILSRTDVAELERLAARAGMVTRWERACQAVETGLTSPGEIRRVLGIQVKSTERRAPQDIPTELI